MTALSGNLASRIGGVLRAPCGRWLIHATVGRTRRQSPSSRPLWSQSSRKGALRYSCAIAGTLGLLVLSASACQQDTSDWLVVENRTDSEIVITQRLADGVDQIGGISPGGTGVVGGIEF